MAHVGFERCPVVIPYYGGKWELSKKLVPMICPHDRYIELFAGGLSMYLRKPKVRMNIINDYDNDVINLYISILEKFDEFSEHLFWFVRSRTLFEDFRKEIMATKDIGQYPDPKRAAKYYYVIKNSFNKNPYNPFSKSDKQHLWHTELSSEVAWSRRHLDGVIIENLDYRELVERYEPRKDDFWYMDPPYMVAGEKKDYYFHDFTMEMHNELLAICNKIDLNDAKFMVSYDDRDEVRALYSKYVINEIKCIYAGAADKKERTELVITNYEPPRYKQESIF